MRFLHFSVSIQMKAEARPAEHLVAEVAGLSMCQAQIGRAVGTRGHGITTAKCSHSVCQTSDLDDLAGSHFAASQTRVHVVQSTSGSLFRSRSNSS
jgi:hypothetical protein